MSIDNINQLKDILEQKMNEYENITIVPHCGADFDAIASAVGIYLIAKKFKRNSSIIFNDLPFKIDPGVQTIINELRSKKYNIINKEKYLQNNVNNDLIILTDVNKFCLTPFDEELKNKEIIIIDHHVSDSQTIKTEYTYIDSKSSSACEIISKLLCLFKIKYDSDVANYLLSGIYLDTNKLSKNVSSETMKIVAKLLENQADISKVNEFFEEDFISDRKIQKLIEQANFLTFAIAVVADDSELEYTKEELAKAADYLLKYKVDAAFSIGKIEENIISISARSKGKINVGEIMQQLNGGGNQYSGATKITDSSIEEEQKKLMKIIKPSFYNEY